ncbi:hypothetical protein [Levilactobacillus wangkuiensis]|uniref:hypothetical protein n=1 Tax=Levilactobacillus wangkuiensis TaxID=2799566 RepID=UPI001942A612|nr:hypothetical protein [Levilactobacillus wangkuiensis]
MGELEISGIVCAILQLSGKIIAYREERMMKKAVTIGLRILASLITIYLGLWYLVNADAEVNTVETVDPSFIWADILLWLEVVLMVLILINLWLGFQISEKITNWCVLIALVVSVLILLMAQALGIFILVILFLALIVWTLNFKLKE